MILGLEIKFMCKFYEYVGCLDLSLVDWVWFGE